MDASVKNFYGVGFGPLISAFGAATDQPVAKEFVR